MGKEFDFTERTALVAGDTMMDMLASTRVIVFGVGGVGSWCVEALARTGIGHICIVDSDEVAVSNINRQLPATGSTIGLKKVDVVAARILDINPEADVKAICGRYNAATAAGFGIETYDYVIDAIDSLADKAHLILRCTTDATAPRRALFSSMGAARKMSAEKIRVAEFWKAEGCPLARALRTNFRRSKQFPGRKFMCVYSPERLPHRKEPLDGANGTFAHATAAFGLRLAELVVTDLYRLNDGK